MFEVEVLGRLALFSGIPESALAELSAICVRRTEPAGTVLMVENDTGDDAYVVLDGSIRVSKAISLDAERTLAELGPGALFGEAAIVDPSERSATARCLVETSLLVLPGAETREWMLRHPHLGVVVMGRLATLLIERLRATNDLLRSSVAWSLDISGASRLGLDRLMSDGAGVRLVLASGREIVGSLAKVDRTAAGYDLWVRDPSGRLHLVPYHALAEIVCDVDLRALASESR